MSIECTNESGMEIGLEELQDLVRHCFVALRLSEEADLAIIAVDEAAMEQLHVQWMDEPGPTDVLSFPMDELRPAKPGDEPATGILGDIVLCPPFALKQAEAAGHSLADELAVLTVHGLLHLVGFDHATAEEEKEMFGLQKQLLDSFASPGSVTS
jgi:probable rRNA maturation factor